MTGGGNTATSSSSGMRSKKIAVEVDVSPADLSAREAEESRLKAELENVRSKKQLAEKELQRLATSIRALKQEVC